MWKATGKVHVLCKKTKNKNKVSWPRNQVKLSYKTRRALCIDGSSLLVDQVEPLCKLLLSL